MSFLKTKMKNSSRRHRRLQVSLHLQLAHVKPFFVWGLLAALNRLPPLYSRLQVRAYPTFQTPNFSFARYFSRSLSREVELPCAQQQHLHVRKFALLATRITAVHTANYVLCLRPCTRPRFTGNCDPEACRRRCRLRTLNKPKMWR